MNVEYNSGGGIHVWYYEGVCYTFYGDKARGKNALFEIRRRPELTTFQLGPAKQQEVRLLFVSIFEANKIVKEEA
jgi:hypothetical protein